MHQIKNLSVEQLEEILKEAKTGSPCLSPTSAAGIMGRFTEAVEEIIRLRLLLKSYGVKP